jgi:exopolysaccharide biosynthesis polyprenyl glycosylphosphotransferase
LLDFLCALAAGLVALEVRFDSQIANEYLAFTAVLPLLWLGSLAVAGGYDPRFIGVGSDEFRKVINAAVSLTAAVAIFSYVTSLDLARGYVVVALPCTAALDLVARYGLRKRLHKRWRGGQDMRRTVAVGHPASVEDLVTLLQRDSHHGLSVVAACVAGAQRQDEVADVPICGGLDSVSSVVSSFNADTVAVLACPEMNGTRLRELAWNLEKTGTEMCVASALLDVAGPRTTIRPIAGLPLLHVDHAELTGAKQVIKGIFDKVSAAFALILLAPVFAVIAVAIKLTDRGPVFFRQTRIGKDGHSFTLWKFRTMIVDAESRKAQLLALNDGNGTLFKMRRDPRVTRPGAWLRRWSLDELPQLLNVVYGNMSLVGPRPALPAEVAKYREHMRRRLVVKPGITGLWQISGRSDLSWDEAERLDLRYVESWSLALDLQILWKTLSAVLNHSGAYLSRRPEAYPGRLGVLPEGEPARCHRRMTALPVTSPRQPAGACWTCARAGARRVTCGRRGTRVPMSSSPRSSPGAVPETPSCPRREATTRRGWRPAVYGSSTRWTAPGSSASPAAATGPCTWRCGRPAS